MKKLFLSLSMLFLTYLASAQQTWFVSGKGNDQNSGKTESTAFRSLQSAADLTKPGDTVIVADGIYDSSTANNGHSILTLRTSGTVDKYITFKAKLGATPEIRPFSWGGITILGSYINIEGLKVIGNNDSITLIDAISDTKNKTPNAKYNTNGIIVEGRENAPDKKPHHIRISNCEVGKCPGGGITVLEGDYVTIEDCKVYENAWYMRYAGSGITTLNNWAFDDKPGYHIIIVRNKVWNNKTLVPWEKTGKLSDGNGILLDVTDQKQGATNPNADAAVDTVVKKTQPLKPRRPEWKGRALIAYNLSVYNGGSGIHTFRTAHVDIINNTTYWNGQVVGYQELFPNRCDDVVIMNNIIVPKPGGAVTSDNKNTRIRWEYNIYPKNQDFFDGTNNILADPLFINPGIDPTRHDFKLSPKSLAMGSGSVEFKFENDTALKLLRHKGNLNRGYYR
ncbi:hypothetical protein EZ428_19080 [Pedobacter frigiditerrae]|uniref:Right handed beta helix domain-containing protein n=1 Tax=Pedobacter frigiditerrae TaxID=2530452 RepID=A0A4R0MPG3_9SPHI|nr:right-handed parallel beta-helix repeat-containing protein [Pedobacter frigiditerrae]TCC88739.1 hypothetical protein EZ428_19080 [Pedobacter frigiditerrae]